MAFYYKVDLSSIGKKSKRKGNSTCIKATVHPNAYDYCVLKLLLHTSYIHTYNTINPNEPELL